MKTFIEKLLFISNILRRRRIKQLQNTNFTILSSNCIGGIIYHILGQEFVSPTINLRINSKDFIRFLNNIDYYLNQNIETKSPCNTSYPVGLLGDIELHFNHYKDIQVASEKWESRKQRINWDNLYIMGNDLDGVVEEDLKSLIGYPCQNIIFFTHRNYSNIPFARYVGDEIRLRSILRHSKLTGLYDFEKWFNYVEFLNFRKYN